jgi:amino acid adenylation domain-containing protein
MVSNGTLEILIDSFLDHSRKRPDTVALIWRGAETSYRQLYRMARTARAEIDRLGLAAQRPVAILAAKSPRSVALVLACQWARLQVLLPSVELPAGTLRKLLEQAGCQHVLCPDGEPSRSATDLVTHVISTAADLPEQAPPRRQPADPADVSFMLTTSGSTGLPKIVPLTAGAVARFTDWAARQFEIGPGTGVLSYAPLNFDLCLLDIWTTLSRGGAVVLVDTDRATNADYLRDLLATPELSVVQAVPMLYQLVGTGDGRRAFDGIRHVIFTGDSMPEPCLAQLPRLFGRARLYNLYGCTETNDSFIHEVNPADPHPPVPLGQPLPGVSALVVDADGQVLAGPGHGELYVCTPFQTSGYLDPALNAGTFADHPERRDGLRYFRTGDLVRRHADGSLTLAGRTDFQVKVRGVRVSTQEVERALLAHDQVREAAVVAVADPLAGHRLHAVVRLDRASGLNSLRLRQHCAQRLPRTAIPSSIQLVDEPLPRTSTGKVDRNQIKPRQTQEG